MSILVINGPNLNMLGQREPDIYGNVTLEDINQGLQQFATDKGHHLLCMQSNAEYELIERVGSGKFGSVWKARVTKLDCTVAIKIPRNDQLGPGEAEIFSPHTWTSTPGHRSQAITSVTTFP